MGHRDYGRAGTDTYCLSLEQSIGEQYKTPAPRLDVDGLISDTYLSKKDSEASNIDNRRQSNISAGDRFSGSR